MLLDSSHGQATVDDICETVGAAEVEAMQVKIDPRDDAWHRFVINARPTYDATSFEPRTACGKSIHGAYLTRDPGYGDKLCADGCFSAYELKLNAELLAAKAEEDRLARLPWNGRTKSQRWRASKQVGAEALAEVKRLTTERLRKLSAEGSQDDEDKDKENQ